MTESIIRKGGNRKVAVSLLIIMLILIIAELCFSGIFLNSLVSKKVEETVPHVDTIDDFVSYHNSEIGLSLMYPLSMPIMTTKEQKDADSALVESFETKDTSDSFAEGFSIYRLSHKLSFLQFKDVVKNNIAANKFKIVSESDTTVGGKPAYFILDNGYTPSYDNTRKFEVKTLIYLIDTGKDYLIVDFSDQISTFDKTVAGYKKVIDSMTFN